MCKVRVSEECPVEVQLRKHQGQGQGASELPRLSPGMVQGRVFYAC